MTLVVNIHRGAAFDVYVGRAGHGHDGYFGNPYGDGSREHNVRRFREYFARRIETDPEYRARVEALRRKRLGCFCAPKACHADVIAAWLDQDEPSDLLAKILATS